jgi:hypothetical protein
LLVGLAAPYVLAGYFELGIGLVACALLLLCRTVRIAWWAVAASAVVVGATAWGAGKAADYQMVTSRVMMRNFYSVLRTRDDNAPVPFRSMVHGGSCTAASCSTPRCGFSRAAISVPTAATVGCRQLAPFAEAGRGHRARAGSMVAHTRKGDTFRFMRSTSGGRSGPTRVHLLADSPATVDVVLGDDA